MQKVMSDSPATGSAPLVDQRRAARSRSNVPLPPQQHDADQQPDVAGLRRPERLDRGARGLGLLIPVADQQVRAEADQLPADEQLQRGSARAPGPSSRTRTATDRCSSGRAPARGSSLQIPERVDLHEAARRARPAISMTVESASARTPTVASVCPATAATPTPAARRAPPACRCHASDRGRRASRRRSRIDDVRRRPAEPPKRRDDRQDQEAERGQQQRDEGERAGVGHHPLSRSR